jgi:hypothetical protein
VGTTAGKIDRNFTAYYTNELIVGIDRELAPNFAGAITAAFGARLSF